MDLFSRECFRMGAKTGGVSTNSLIALLTEGCSKTISSMEMVSSGGQMVKSTEETGKKTRCMGKESLVGLMEGNTRAISRMMSSMERENSFGRRQTNQIRGHTTVTGLTENSTVSVFIRTIRIKRGGESGRMVNFSAGWIRITIGYQSKILSPMI